MTALQDLIEIVAQAIEEDHFGLFAIGTFAVIFALVLLRFAQ